MKQVKLADLPQRSSATSGSSALRTDPNDILTDFLPHTGTSGLKVSWEYILKIWMISVFELQK
jgi:hypothetical protein